MHTFTGSQWSEFLSANVQSYYRDYLLRIDPTHGVMHNGGILMARTLDDNPMYSVGFFKPTSNEEFKFIMTEFPNPSRDDDGNIMSNSIKLQENGTITLRPGGRYIAKFKIVDDKIIHVSSTTKIPTNYLLSLAGVREIKTWRCHTCLSRNFDTPTHELEGHHICATCQGQRITCGGCGLEVVQSNGSRNRLRACNDCYRNSMRHCDDCGNRHWVSEQHELDSGTVVCTNCYGYYEVCDRCGREWRNPHGDTCICRQNITEYTYTRAYKFLGGKHEPECDDGEIYISPELEVEVPTRIDRHDIAGAVKGHNGDILCKEDSSIDNGFEVTGQPATLKWFQNGVWENIIDTLRDSKCTSHDSGTCGLHIHISRHNLSRVDEIKMAYFCMMYGKFMTRFARRDYGTYCIKRTKRLDNSARSSEGRSDAINFRNDTVELRQPRGTLNKISFFATLEWADALVRFCKVTDMKEFHNEDECIKKFIFMAERGKRRYPNLFIYMNTRGIIKAYNYTTPKNLDTYTMEDGDYQSIKVVKYQESEVCAS